ncbi:hypothetical protein P8A18_11805 [Streptomyces castrisilvae]|uniref:Lipoprotein n=1 Tax=Streptomyces castrisilvae TaxID=3033811 RepID=A0ABY9HIA6_9ACTN|nr:hypothetical protein [Streptomyces sp. Mut1]WLQ34084.1 hypothetical protein P8A18_11805 [Streptomyces sp. Mut1]
MRLLGCVLLAVLLTACRVEKDQEEPKMDMQQAGQRAEAILDGTMAAIQPPVEWVRGSTSESPCSTGLNEPTGTTTVMRGRNILTVISEHRRGELLEMVQRYWEDQGFRDFDIDHDKKMPQIRATAADGLTVILDVGNIGNVYIHAGFGCAQDSEMTYPEGTPGRPGGPKKVERIPREHSPYWSVTGP